MLCRSFDLSGCAFLHSGHLLTPGRRCLCHLVRVYVLQAEPDATHGDDKTLLIFPCQTHDHSVSFKRGPYLEMVYFGKIFVDHIFYCRN